MNKRQKKKKIKKLFKIYGIVFKQISSAAVERTEEGLDKRVVGMAHVLGMPYGITKR